MSQGNMTGYLPGDPRYGLSGEALRNYYRTKPAQWAIYCWDKPGMQSTRRALLPDQTSYVKNFGERVIGYAVGTERLSHRADEGRPYMPGNDDRSRRCRGRWRSKGKDWKDQGGEGHRVASWGWRWRVNAG